MNRNLRKFLAAGTAFCLCAAPALAQDHAASPGSLNASRAIDNARKNAATMGDIGKQDMDAYQRQMRSAMAITDPPRRDAAVTSARQQLARSITKPLTAGTISELDGLLDVGGASPQLGATG